MFLDMKTIRTGKDIDICKQKYALLLLVLVPGALFTVLHTHSKRSVNFHSNRKREFTSKQARVSPAGPYGNLFFLSLSFLARSTKHKMRTS